jgi:uncharacterized cupredoxin-like copper-binding protein
MTDKNKNNGWQCSFKEIIQAIRSLLETWFTSDRDVFGYEVQKIFSNAEDRKMYIDAVETLRMDPGKKIKIILSTKEEITLVCYRYNN